MESNSLNDFLTMPLNAKISQLLRDEASTNKIPAQTGLLSRTLPYDFQSEK